MDNEIYIRYGEKHERKELIAIAKTSKHTSGFSNHHYSGELIFEKNWIIVAELKGEVVGFACVRHGTRNKYTSLYYMVVLEKARRLGVGRALLKKTAWDSPHDVIRLRVSLENQDALRFYQRIGFYMLGEAHMSDKNPYARLEWKVATSLMWQEDSKKEVQND